MSVITSTLAGGMEVGGEIVVVVVVVGLLVFLRVVKQHRQQHK
jgi:hypothetical protein